MVVTNGPAPGLAGLEDGLSMIATIPKSAIPNIATHTLRFHS